jgi:hypothetical protein
MDRAGASVRGFVMRRLVVLAWLGACELQPPPKQAPAPPPPAAEAGVAKPAPADAGIAHVIPDAAPVTDDCENIGAHVAQVLIDSAKDASLKAEYERSRTQVVRTIAEGCSSQHWSDDARHCFLDAKVEADVRACEKKFPPPAK